MLNLNSLKILLFLIGMWSLPSLAANSCLKGKIPSEKQFEEAQRSIASDKNFDFANGQMTKSFNKLQLPENLSKCAEYDLAQSELHELETKWRWMALKYPTNLDYVFNYKLFNSLFIYSMGRN